MPYSHHVDAVRMKVLGARRVRQTDDAYTATFRAVLPSGTRWTRPLLVALARSIANEGPSVTVWKASRREAVVRLHVRYR